MPSAITVMQHVPSIVPTLRIVSTPSGTSKTLIPFHKALLAAEQWRKAETARDLLEDKKWLKTLAFEKAPKRAEDEEEKVEQSYNATVAGVLLLSEDLLQLASGGVFCLVHPDHPFTREVQQIARRIMAK